MKALHKSVLIWFSPQQMFDVVTDVARYHEFLPWCHHSSTEEMSQNIMQATIGMQLAGFSQSFTTHNEHIQKANGDLAVKMTLVKGPFSHLHGTWSFEAISGSAIPSCQVTLQLHYAIESKLLQLAIGSAFDKIAESLVNAFIERAKKIYAQ